MPKKSILLIILPVDKTIWGGRIRFFKNHKTINLMFIKRTEGFPGGSGGKASVCNAGDPSLIPGLGRSPGEGNGNPL